MTKKEQAELNALRLERDMHAAMWIGKPVDPDIDMPAGLFEVTTGFMPTVYGGPQAQRAAVASGKWAIGEGAWLPEVRHWSRGEKRLYSKELDALRAARYEYAAACAKVLAECDCKIAELEERKGNDPANG